MVGEGREVFTAGRERVVAVLVEVLVELGRNDETHGEESEARCSAPHNAITITMIRPIIASTLAINSFCLVSLSITDTITLAVCNVKQSLLDTYI
jgi:hypothetical protein